MINLFTITETYEVELNKEWILLHPAFAAILKADKGSPGDSEGRKKLKARKQLAYIYFMVDFRSPIYSYDDAKKKFEALRYVGLDDIEVESPMIDEALREYEAMQLEQARSIKTLQAAKKGMNALDDYMNNIDFDARDKQGKLVNSPKEFVANLKELNKAYDEIDKFEKRVYKDLQENNATIRGTAELGDKERIKKEKSTTWEEGTDEIVSGAHNPATGNFGDLSVMLSGTRKRSKSIEEEGSENYQDQGGEG